MPDRLLIRADASTKMGTGHVMRMLALAQAFQDRGGAVTLVCSSCPEDIAGRVHSEGIALERIEGGMPGSARDLEWTVARAKSLGTKWVVLDGYHFNVADHRALRDAGFRVLAVDDYGHCATWAADAVLNQNIFAPELTYHSEVEGCRFLLGTRFALLRREFRDDAECGADRQAVRSHVAESIHSRLPGSAAVQHPPLRQILVTLGGVDAGNVSGRMLAALNAFTGSRLEIKLLVGAGNPHFDKLRQLAATSPHAIVLLQNVLDMPSLYRWADGVISAGGSTCWEWLFYQLPAAVVCLADNQRPVIAGLVKHRLALELDWDPDRELESTALKLRAWLNRTIPLDAVPQNLAVDGLGADRVASWLDGTHAWLRRARAEDARLWFEWANDPEVRANGFHPDPIPWETHLEWFEHHRQSPDSRLWISFDLDQRPLGCVRLHRCDDSEWEVGITVVPERRGQGIARKLVRLALRRFSVGCPPSARRGVERPDDRAARVAPTAATAMARVKPGNTASLSLFHALGFQPDASRTTSDYCVLTCKLVDFL